MRRMEKKPEFFQNKPISEIKPFKDPISSLEVSGDGKAVKKTNKNKYFYIGILCILIFSVITFLIIFYKRNFTPDAILNRSFKNVLADKNFKYDGTVKLTFLYADREESVNVSDLEIYSLLKKPTADYYETVVQGKHDWSRGYPEGMFVLTWSVSDEKVFGFEGNYQGYELFYKANPYIYEDLVDEQLKKNYSKVDIKDLLEKSLTFEDNELFRGVRFEDFQFRITEVYQNDFIDSKESYHYRIKLSGVNNADKLLSGFKHDDLDVWVEKESKKIQRIKGKIEFVDIGMEGNNMDLLFDFKFDI